RRISANTDDLLESHKKSCKKSAPIPPKRTSSFRTQHEASSSSQSGLPPPPPDQFPLEVDLNCVNNSVMTDSRQSQSSSEELLSTPASHSRSGSLERILENKIMSQERSRSNSWDRSGSSPVKGELKTPDTDISDVSLPLPPPSLIEEEPKIDSTPLSYLRQSLRKTQHPKPKKTAEDAEGVGTLDSANVKKSISRYGTIPKGARIGQFLASLEDSSQDAPQMTQISPSGDNKLSDSCSNVADMVLKMPTPEVRRKVEEWQQGVEQSMAAELKGSNGEVQPSNLVRSSSFGMGTTDEKSTIVSTFLTRQKSDVTPDKPGSPLAKRTTKPTPSPRAQHKFKSSTLPVDKSSERVLQREASQNLANILSSPQRVGGMATARTTSSSSEEVLDNNSANSCIGNAAGKKKKGKANMPIVAPYTSSRSENTQRKFGTQEKEKSKKEIKESKEPKVKSPTSGFKSQGSIRDKLGLFKQSSKEKSKESAPPPAPSSSSSVNKPSGAKAMQPSIGQVIQSAGQLPARSTLHHIKSDESNGNEAAPVTKETVIALSGQLSSYLDEMNSVRSKHSSNFLQLSEQVQVFYRSCSSYVESLPPHGKFKVQELVSRLEKVADGLKTCSSASSVRGYDTLLTELLFAVHACTFIFFFSYNICVKPNRLKRDECEIAFMRTAERSSHSMAPIVNNRHYFYEITTWHKFLIVRCDLIHHNRKVLGFLDLTEDSALDRVVSNDIDYTSFWVCGDNERGINKLSLMGTFSFWSEQGTNYAPGYMEASAVHEPIAKFIKSRMPKGTIASPKGLYINMNIRESENYCVSQLFPMPSWLTRRPLEGVSLTFFIRLAPFILNSECYYMYTRTQLDSTAKSQFSTLVKFNDPNRDQNGNAISQERRVWIENLK
ncbi:hypothetical protein CAPTEDRAFT_190507, partial [Capitella teleta]